MLKSLVWLQRVGLIRGTPARLQSKGHIQWFWAEIAKYVMRTKSRKTYTKAKLEVDTKLLEELRQIGIVKGIGDFSRACGKNPTYFACMRKRGYSLHVGSLAFLQARLARELDETTNVHKRAKLRIAMSAINETVQEKCKLRELELLS